MNETATITAASTVETTKTTKLSDGFPLQSPEDPKIHKEYPLLPRDPESGTAVETQAYIPAKSVNPADPLHSFSSFSSYGSSGKVAVGTGNSPPVGIGGISNDSEDFSTNHSVLTEAGPENSTTNNADGGNSSNTTNCGDSVVGDRNAVVMAVFGPTVGRCVADFATSYNRVNGRLYASTEAILFYSNLFGFERKLCLQLSDILDIQTFRSTSIQVTTIDLEEYVFKKIQRREYALLTLQDLLQKSTDRDEMEQRLQDEPPALTPSSISSSTPASSTATTTTRYPYNYKDGTPQNRNSKELYGTTSTSSVRPSSRRRNMDSMDKSYHGPRPARSTTPVRRRSLSAPRRRRSLSAPFMKPFGKKTQQQQQQQESRSTSRPFRRMSLSIFCDTNDNDEDNNVMKLDDEDEASKKEQDSCSDADASTTVDTNADVNPAPSLQQAVVQDEISTGAGSSTSMDQNITMIKTEWEKVKQPLEEEVIGPIILSSSLTNCYELFFSNDARYPIAKYQRDTIGDINLQVSVWENFKDSDDKDKSSNCQTETQTTAVGPGNADMSSLLDCVRKIQFIHPLKNSLGPTEAKTTRQQRLRKFANYGICIENSTNVEGIPAADCFRVEDRWILETVKTTSKKSTASSESGEDLVTKSSPHDVDPTNDHNDVARLSSSCVVRMSVSFRILFTKRTMLKVLIQKNIRQETKNWFRGYTEMLQKVLAERDKGISSVVRNASAKIVANHVPSDDTTPTNAPYALPEISEVKKANKNQSLSSYDYPMQKRYYSENDGLPFIFIITSIIGFSLLLFAAIQLVWMRHTLESMQTEFKQLQLDNKELLSMMQGLTTATPLQCSEEEI